MSLQAHLFSWAKPANVDNHELNSPESAWRQFWPHQNEPNYNLIPSNASSEQNMINIELKSGKQNTYVY